VAQLLVKQGDKVRSGQVVAILDSRDRLLAALEQAKEKVRVAQASLAQVKAGAKSGEINAQKATIARLEAEQQGEISAQVATVARIEAQLRNAQTEYQRYQSLYQSGAISSSNRDSKGLTLETVQQQLNEAKANLNRLKQAKREQLNEAKATLNRIAEVRPVDVQAAQAEVNNAIASVKKAQADLDLAYVRSPRDGRILKIHTWSGEVVGNEGIADLGQTDQMYVVAEVYESDLSKVRLGQRALVTSSSSAFSGESTGIVDEIGWQIRKKDVLNTDPVADVDARVAEVKIRLDAAATSKVARFTNSQVTVTIKL
jgi:HlyD family secretion protein